MAPPRSRHRPRTHRSIRGARPHPHAVAKNTWRSFSRPSNGRRKLCPEPSTPPNRRPRGSQELRSRPKSVSLHTSESFAPTDPRHGRPPRITSNDRRRSAHLTSIHFTPPEPHFREILGKPPSTVIAPTACAAIGLTHRPHIGIAFCARSQRPQTNDTKIPLLLDHPDSGDHEFSTITIDDREQASRCRSFLNHHRGSAARPNLSTASKLAETMYFNFR